MADDGFSVLPPGSVRGKERVEEAKEGGGMSEDEEGFEAVLRFGRGPLLGTRKEAPARGAACCGIGTRGAFGLGRGGGSIAEDGDENMVFGRFGTFIELESFPFVFSCAFMIVEVG